MSAPGDHRIETDLIHAGEILPRIEGAVSLPIFQSAMFEYAGESSYHDLKYIRLNNTPNHLVLGRKLATLEGAEAGVVTASGMAAISTALLTVLSPGDVVLVSDCLYGGTHDLLTGELRHLGIEHVIVDATAPDTWAAAMDAAPGGASSVKAIHVESITNPLVGVGALSDVVAFARERGLVSLIDNTFASPIHYRAAAAGFDVVLHSCTKYLNGHSDIVAGAILGSRAWIERITHRLNHLGGTLDPHACFLLHRGVKTLALRVRAQTEGAMRIAAFLDGHDAVERVFYPGLETSPDHARAKANLTGFGAMLSFELKGGLTAATDLLARVRLPVVAPSLGGVESLLTLPATTSHAGMSKADREAAGIADGLVRMSVGIEAVEDLIDDLGQALETPGG